MDDGYSGANFAEEGWEFPVTERLVPIASVDSNFGRPWLAVNQQEPVLEGAYDAPVYVVERQSAKSRRKVEPGTWIYDLEQEMAGVPRLTFHEKAGTKITVRYAEMLYPDMPKYGKNSGKIMVENYRDAASTDTYICCSRVRRG